VQARDRRERFVVLRSMVAMAHGLDRKVVAEGVEAESDIADLVQLGCEYGQGFLFGEATDARSAIELITEEFRLAGQ
jgi:EAL domain-containing protein (putative c-di-GMP-specific phosphodiesterase class I)